jgi:putative ABC transport system permease protein
VKSCLIGQTVAEQLFPGREPLGAIVRVGHMPCEVIGVLAPKGMSAGGLNQDDAVVMPLATARGRLGVRAAGRPGSVSLIVLTTRLPRDTSRVEQDVKRLLRQRHAIGPDDEDDFNVRNLAEIARTAQATVITIKTLLLVVALISLVVGGIGIMNIMLVSVTERTREIGIRLAIGATARDVLLQFLVESVVLTALGGAIGVTLGAIVAAATRAALGWRTELDPSVVLMAVLFSGGVGVVFGLIPSVRAARLDPIEALRHE